MLSPAPDLGTGSMARSSKTAAAGGGGGARAREGDEPRVGVAERGMAPKEGEERGMRREKEPEPEAEAEEEELEGRRWLNGEPLRRGTEE